MIIFYFARLSVCSRSFNPDTWGTCYTVFPSRVQQIFQGVHSSRDVLATPIPTTFTLALCLKNAASVCTSTLENEPEIVMLLSFIRFHFHERPHFGYIYMIEHPLDSTEQLIKIPRNPRRISNNLQMTWKRRVLVCRNRWSGKSNS